ncbi:MAG: hypothetical protein ABI867_28190 [Kofleriaceae bacterium]
MRTLVLTFLVLVATQGAARADFGIGLFVGEPTGLDLKIDLQPRSAIDIVLGVVSINDGGRDVSYGHLTYLYTLTVARGRTVRIPLRLGIGASLFGVTEDNTQLAARVPFELGLRFRRSPLEIYGEIAFVLRLIDDVDTNIDGGIGLRLYF